MKSFRDHLGVTLTGGLEEVVTPWAGVSLLVETYRRCGVGASGLHGQFLPTFGDPSLTVTKPIALWQCGMKSQVINPKPGKTEREM